MTPDTVTIRLGCDIKEEIYRSRRLGAVTLTRRRTWLETFAVPQKGHNKINLVCPTCHSPFAVKVYSRAKARLRKLYFASCFFAIAACGIAFGVWAGSEKGFMGYSIAAPFIIFAVWQLLNAIRGRFYPSDIVSHAGGKVHRIYDEKKVIFPD